MADKRDPRHAAGQAHIDHLMSRYSLARDAKKAGKDYDQADIDNVKKAGLMTDQEISKDFPAPKKKSIGQTLKDNLLGTDEQNEAAEEREKARARANPEGNEAKFRRMMGKEFKSGGKVSSASSRGDGCAIRGKTKGRMV